MLNEKATVLCLALTACTGAASPTTLPVPSNSASATVAPSGTAANNLPKPASVSVEGETVIGRDDKGTELFRGVFKLDQETISFSAAGAPTRGFSLPLSRFPGTNVPSEWVIAVGKDGVALVGGSDGSLFAVDYNGAPQLQIGVRGPVRGIEARQSGGYVVSTIAGDVIIDPASRAIIEPPPRIPAPITFVARPPMGGRAPQIVLAADDAWALEEDFSKVGPTLQTLHHFDGKTWSAVRMEALEATKSVTLGSADFHATGLSRGPKGQLLVVGYERGWSKLGPDVASYEMRVFERAGDAFRARPDIAPALARTRLVNIFTSPGDVSYAAGPGDREIVCLRERCLVRGLPTSFHFPTGVRPVRTSAPGWSFFEWSDGGQMGRRATIWAAKSLYRFDLDGFTRDGKKLLDTMPLVDDIIDGKYPPPPDPYRASPAREWRDIGSPTQGLWASGPDDVWVSAGMSERGSVIFRWNGKTISNVPCPLSWVDWIWGSGPDDVWFSGEGVAHHDGHEIHRIPGIPAGPIVGGAAGEAWIGNWHVLRATATLPDLQATSVEAPPISRPSAAIDVTHADNGFRAEDAKVVISGDAPLTSALGITEGAGGLLWVHDTSRLVEISSGGARVLYRAAARESLDGGRGAAQTAMGEGAFLTTGPDGLSTLRTISKGRVADVISWPALRSIAPLPNGEMWATSATDVKGMASALSLTTSGIRNIVGLPEAAYASVAVRAQDDVWLSGGLTTAHEETGAEPAGEGILVHYDGKAFTRYRGPEGALLSVAAVGPAEAWAVGYDGGIVHVKGGVVTAYHLEREGKQLRVALRAVAATGPDDVWISGDGSTLIHFDGKAFSKVDVPSVGVDAALTAVVPPRDKAAGWLSGPRGIWRLSRVESRSGVGP